MTDQSRPLADNELDAARLPAFDKQSTLVAAETRRPTRRLSDTARLARRSGTRERDLDWNVVTLPPNGEFDTAGTDVDAVIRVLSGSGRLTTATSTIPLTAGAVLWLPSRARPRFIAGPDGLRYLTVNQKWKILPP
ncbi:hypothetical protein QRB36_05870 [Mycobacterium marseillense]|uniref:cupin domain-containing protein n=1 Tax=Mycobacterium marseillense TaxID=701042 RepID=UPI0025975A35|nr:hypothetical protein [Mycobacterium marseillense]MDM3973691.1 hypothetical protein [Mycobacterium marseillense]